METFIAATISGLGTGAVYALLAVGFVIIYRATKCSAIKQKTNKDD